MRDHPHVDADSLTPMRSSRRHVPVLAAGVIAILAACSDDGGAGGASTTDVSATTGVGTTTASGTGSTTQGSASSSGSASTNGAGGGAGLRACGDSANAPNAWISNELAGAPVLTGDFDARQFVELPRLLRDVTATNAKYAFDFQEMEGPADPRVGLINVRVTDLVSNDAFGGSLVTDDAPGAHLFLSNVHLEPNWPAWESYATTNYDGMVLDDSEDIYAEDLTIVGWNADSAIDIKSNHAELVCLVTQGNGNRTLRFWKPGPHYLVKSTLENQTGDIVWMSDCSATQLFVFDSTFNGEAQLPADKISCEEGQDPQIVYLDVDPRTTGEMHPMFGG